MDLEMLSNRLFRVIKDHVYVKGVSLPLAVVRESYFALMNVKKELEVYHSQLEQYFKDNWYIKIDLFDPRLS